MLKNIRPSVKEVTQEFGKGTSADDEFVRKVTKQNVRDAIHNIRTQSPVLVDLEKQGNLKLVGAVYHMDSGAVEFLDD